MKVLLLFLLIVHNINVFAQVQIEGKLLERGTKKVLSKVNIFILPHKLKTTTNKDGAFNFQNVPEGDFEFIVNNPGHIRLKQKASTQQKIYDLYLEKEMYNIFETTVTALAEKRDITQKSLNQKDFLLAPGAQEDPIKAVQNLPGIAKPQFNSAKVVIQGNSPDDTGYTLNGHDIPLVFHFGGLSSIIMPQVIESVDYLSSGYGPEYGRALGGIINLQTRLPKEDRWHGLAFIDIYNSGGLIEGPIDDKSSIFFSTRYGYIGHVFKEIAKESEEFDLTVAPTFTDVFLKYSRKITPIDEFTLIAIRSEDKLQFVLKEPVEQDPTIRGDFFQRTRFHRVIPRWKRKFNDKYSLDLSIGYGDNDILFEVGDNYFEIKSTTFSQRAELKAKHYENYTSYLGIDAQRVDYNVRVKFPENGENRGGPSGDLMIADITDKNIENALYLRNKILLFNRKFNFSPNLRFSHFSRTDEDYLMPRISLSYQYSDSLTYSAATGVYYQAPQKGKASKESGNPDLKSEKAIHYLAGIKKDFRAGSSNGFILEMDLFYKDLTQVIVESSDTDDLGNPEVYSNKGTGRIHGIQSQLKFKWSEFTFVSGYTYLKSLRTEPKQEEYPSEYDQTHNLNIIASYKRSRWTFSARLRFVTGNPYTPIENGIFDSDRDVYIPVSGDYFSKRYQSFFQLDIRFDRKWIYDTWILSAYLDIQNITNNDNVESISYNFDYSDSVQTTGLPLIPIFGIKGEF